MFEVTTIMSASIDFDIFSTEWDILLPTFKEPEILILSFSAFVVSSFTRLFKSFFSISSKHDANIKMSMDADVSPISFFKKSYFSIAPFIGLTGNNIFSKFNHFWFEGTVSTGQDEIFITFCAIEPIKNLLTPE